MKKKKLNLMDLKIEMLKKGVRRIDLGRAINKSESMISKYLNGYLPIPEDVLEKIEKYLSRFENNEKAGCEVSK